MAPCPSHRTDTKSTTARIFRGASPCRATVRHHPHRAWGGSWSRPTASTCGQPAPLHINVQPRYAV
eukprot:8140322-Pyramimonas_sp.AAC.1